MTGDVDGVDGRDAGDGHDRVAGNPADTGRPADAHEVTAPDGRAITRRQLLVGASVAGLSGVAAGALLGHYATGGSGGGDEGAGRSVPAGGASGPQLGVVMPGDPRPDAPELAHRGPFGVGVRGWTVTNPDQIDVVHYLAGSPVPRYDRPLPLMVWYPAVIPAHTAELTTYSDVLGSGNDPMRPNTAFEFAGRALRGAAPDAGKAPYPLLIVSHGYPGSDVLLTNLTENLASKGYVVVAIQHTDSTHGDAAGITSTLLNRPLDIDFVLEQMAALGAKGSGSFLTGLVDAGTTALIGYSMGGYGVLICAGAGITAAAAAAGAASGAPRGALKVLEAGTAPHAALVDPRVKAIVPIAPWGGAFGVWDAAALNGIKVPALFVVGDRDQTAPYAGVRFIFEHAIDADRYLLVHQSGDHEVAVNPAPPITFTRWREYVHYQEPALDNTRTNNVNQHFLTAFLGLHLKGADYQAYLDVKQADSNVANNESNPGYPAGIWKGFPEWSAVGLELHHLRP
jgi:predicted dienelactone hydrolase